MLDRLVRDINRALEFSLCGLGLALALTAALQVFCRYLLNYSLFWSEELARFLLVWLTFLGAAVAYQRGSHAAVDFVYKRLSPPYRRGAGVLVHLAALAFFLILVIHGTRFAYFVRLQVSPALGLPKWIPLTVIPLSGALMALSALAFLGREIRGLRSGR